MTTSREDAITLGAIGIVDGSGTRTRSGFVTNVCNDDYVTEVMADDPIGFWKMDETSGSTLANSATKSGGAADDLTLIPGTGGALDASMTHAGVTHKGVDFDYGAGNIAVATEASAWLPQAYPFCLEAVMKWNSETDGVIMRLTMDDEAGSPYYGGGGDAFSTKIYTMSSERIGCISYNETNGAGSSSATDVFQDGEVIHVFVRCMEADYVGHASCHLYINGLYIRSWGYYDVFSGSYGYSQLQVGARYNNSLSVITESNSIIGLAAVYDVDVPGARVQAHAAALRKHYDLELKGSTTAISAFAGSGGYAIESDGTAANHAEIGDPRGDPYSPQSAGSILDEISRREQTFGQREPDYPGGDTGRTQGRDYTIVVAVSRDSYSDADVILANNSSTTHANTVNDGFWYHGHASASYRGADDGIRIEIQADDTVRFTHVNLTVDSTETITNTDTKIITARFDGSGGASYEDMTLFIDGADKQQNTSIYPNAGYNGATSGGISTFMAAADEDADGFDGRIGCLMFFPTALSDAEILSLSEKLLDEAGSAPNNPPTGSVTISGTPTEDQVLTAANTLADADGLGTISYQWKRGGSEISGATDTTYTLVQADVGSTITVTASYTDGGGTAESVTSSATSAVANVNDPPTGTVTISGTTTVGQTLTAANTLADEDVLGAISYQWKRNGVAIGGATSSTYVLALADVGTNITVTASYTDGQGTAESMTSAATLIPIPGFWAGVVTTDPVTFTRRWSPDSYSRGLDAESAVAEWEAAISTGTTVSTEAVQSSSNIPIRINDPHPDFPGRKFRCERISIQRPGFKMFRLRADFSVPEDQKKHSGTLTSDDPMQNPAVFHWTSTIQALPIDREFDGNPIVNSSFEPADPNPTREVESIVLQVKRNFDVFVPDRAMHFSNSINLDNFLGAKPGEVKCTKIVPTTDFTLGSEFVELIFEFEYRDDEIWGTKPHQLRMLDQGLRGHTKYGESGDAMRVGRYGLIKFKETGELVPGPVLLNGFGVPLDKDSYSMDEGAFHDGPSPSGAQLDNSVPGAVFLLYDIYKTRAFSPLRQYLGI